MKPEPTPKYLKWAKKELGCKTIQEFADLIGTPYRTVQDLLLGTTPIRGVYVRVVDCLLSHHAPRE